MDNNTSFKNNARKELGKKRASRLNDILDRFSGSPSFLYTHNTFDSSNLPRIYPADVSNWRKGGYIDKKTGVLKGYLTEEKARDVITVINKRMETINDNTHFRLEYLLGYDDYMTDVEKEEKERDNLLTEYTAQKNKLSSVISLLELSGYTITLIHDEIQKDIEENTSYSQRISFYNVEKNGITHRYSVSQLSAFADSICNYTDFLIKEYSKTLIIQGFPVS